jgi:hypothetical protein
MAAASGRRRASARCWEGDRQIPESGDSPFLCVTKAVTDVRSLYYLQSKPAIIEKSVVWPCIFQSFSPTSCWREGLEAAPS